jgi:hypothetical protein
LKWKPDVGWVVGAEGGTQHSNDHVRFACEQNGSPHQASIRTEPAAPQSVADHHQPWPSGNVFLCREGSADLDLRAE